MQSSGEKWNERYRAKSGDVEPLATLREYAPLFPTSGNALDLACGRAGNAELLASRGMSTSAWDISGVVIEQVREYFTANGLAVDARVRDVEASPPAPSSFDVIVVSRFLSRLLAPSISDALKPGGLLFYQTFVRDKPGVGGPSNPDYLLAPGELLELFAGLTTRVFVDLGRCGAPAFGLRDEALLIAQKPLDSGD